MNEKAGIEVPVDVANPGHFFACCGLLELACRFYPGAEGWFEGGRFRIRSSGAASLSDLLARLKSTPVAEERQPVVEEQTEDDEKEDARLQPLELVFTPPVRLRLDWWTDKAIKTWAGSMNARDIYVAMAAAIDPLCPDPLNDGRVVYDPPVKGAESNKSKKGKKREPFYFDARRGASARSLDVGFAPDALDMTTLAFPAVEALCFIGLQRFRPMPTDQPRVLEYFAWSLPLEAQVAPIAACGLLADRFRRGFRFENAFRTDQRKHKAFTPAVPLSRS